MHNASGAVRSLETNVRMSYISRSSFETVIEILLMQMCALCQKTTQYSLQGKNLEYLNVGQVCNLTRQRLTALADFIYVIVCCAVTMTMSLKSLKKSFHANIMLLAGFCSPLQSKTNLNMDLPPF